MEVNITVEFDEVMVAGETAFHLGVEHAIGAKTEATLEAQIISRALQMRDMADAIEDVNVRVTRDA